MMEVEAAAGAVDDHCMEWEEPLETFSSTPVRLKEKEERINEAVHTPITVANPEVEKSPEPVRIIPIPPESVTTLPTPSKTVMPAGSTLGFMVNGRPIHLPPGGGAAELRLHSHPEGSASGFTTIQIPVTLTLHSPLGTRYITTSASLTASSSAPPPPPPVASFPPAPEPIPIITGVVSGEAAKKVLNDHSVNLSSGSQKADKTPPSAETDKPKKSRSKPRPSRIAAPDKLLKKGEVGAATPPDCQICKSQYKLITELRGFICMCSPEITEGLLNLRKQRIKRARRARERRKANKLSKGPQIVKEPQNKIVSPAKVVTPPRRIHRYPAEVQSDELSSPLPHHLSSPSHPLSSPSHPLSPPSHPLSPPPRPPSHPLSPPPRPPSHPLSPPPHSLTPQQPEKLVPVEYPPTKLVIMVEDFFYGRSPGRGVEKDNLLDERFRGSFHCIHCSVELSNNIRLMDHMQQHVSTLSQEDGHVENICPSCFRHFPSAFSLQSHMKDVHNQKEPAAICKICELAFDNEPALLCHMKSTHKPGEMPYACQVCDFRSSFYSDVWSHFREAHSDTRELLCRYCLRVLHSNTCYQQHFARHQKKQTLSCDKCRLHFLYVKERAEHRALQHVTHVTPPQLSGLKPGTKVTVRMYSVIGSERKEDLNKVYIPSKVVDVAPPPFELETSKRRPVESLGTLLSGLSANSDFDSSQRCVECLKSVSDLEIHFPTLVHCSFCKFSTCCSNSYANHMINNHTIWREPQFPTIFQLSPREPNALRCDSCDYSTFNGDAMANHVTERPGHICTTLTEEERTTKQAENHTSDNTSDNTPVSENQGSSNGGFVPIQLNPVGPTSPQLSVKALRTTSSPPFKPAMTIKLMGAAKWVSPLSYNQLSIVLSSLCHGISETTRRTSVSQALIRSWIATQQRGLAQRRWNWKTDKMAQWVLDRREQQLSVTEAVLLLTARAALGNTTPMEECYSWTIDFMLRHDLGLQTTNNSKLRSIREHSRSFVQSIYSQFQKGVLTSWGCMDELPVFINLDKFSKQQASAFQLFGSPEDKPIFDVILTALSDGCLLPPLLFFKGTATSIPEGFPDNVLLEAREDGFTEEERLQIWIQKVWQPCVTSKHGDGSLLVMDVHRGHLSETFKESLSAVKTNIAYIPAGCSSRLQPLEICVMQVLRDFLQARWSQLVVKEGLDGLRLDQLALTFACWLSEVASILNSKTETLRSSASEEDSDMDSGLSVASEEDLDVAPLCSPEKDSVCSEDNLKTLKVKPLPCPVTPSVGDTDKRKAVGQGVGRRPPGVVPESWNDAEVPDITPPPPIFEPLRQPGPQLTSTSSFTPLQLFWLFFTNATMLKIVQNTNEFAAANATPSGTWTDICLKDLHSYMALVIYMGLVKCCSVGDYWRTAKLYRFRFPKSVMTSKRFFQICWNLQLNSRAEDAANDAKRETPEYDRLCKVKPLYEELRDACKSNYHPNENISIHERVVASKARVFLRQNMKNKPTASGFQLFVLADSSNGYTWDFFVYQGRSQQPSGKGAGYDCVMQLVDTRQLGTGYKLFVDSFFTSPVLFRDLLDKNIWACGTIKAFRLGQLRSIANSLEPKSPQGTIRWLRRDRLLFVQWTGARDVNLCSTLHTAHGQDTVQRWVKAPDGHWSLTDVPVPPAVKEYNQSFTIACSVQQLENQGEAARMISALTRALTQPPVSGSQEPGAMQGLLVTPGSGLKQTPSLLLVMKQDWKKNGPSAQAKADGTPMEVSSPTALRQVFNSESDAESFHGFTDV